MSTKTNPCLMTAEVQVEYRVGLGRKMKLTFEMSGNRQEGCSFSHVMNDETGDEVEFPDFRKVIDYCNKPDRPNLFKDIKAKDK